MTPTAGLSFKPVHFQEALASPAVGLWFEVHAENYMVSGGVRLAMLESLRRERPVSVHGVGLSLASAAPPDRRHLDALKRLCDRVEPFMVSEHLAWSRMGDLCFPDLLPFPRTTEALGHIARNIDIAQSVLGRAILVENPSLYLQLEGHEWDEAAFLGELVRRTGCGILLDVTNVRVSSNNLGLDPLAYLNALPAQAVSEIHLAGYRPDPNHGQALLIDSHDAPVADEVWELYRQALARFGPVPTLIERDDDIPGFSVLMAERERAAQLLQTCCKEVAHA